MSFITASSLPAARSANTLRARPAAIHLYIRAPFLGLAEPEPRVNPPQRPRCPPVPPAQKLHQRRHQQRPDQGGVDRDADDGAESEFLDEDDARGDEGT